MELLPFRNHPMMDGEKKFTGYWKLVIVCVCVGLVPSFSADSYLQHVPISI